jgi:RNA polymerase sigma factor (TIGR02999 family)
MEHDAADVTRLLGAWRGGDTGAFDRLVGLLYDELRSRAAGLMRSERPGHTLQPTALVHEAWARLARAEVDFVDRSHFLAVAARAMRRVLVDHARARRSDKRGAGAPHVTLGEDQAIVADSPEVLLDADRHLAALEAHDPRKAEVAELHYFGGMTVDEIAGHLGIAPITARRDLRFARAWLRARLVRA